MPSSESRNRRRKLGTSSAVGNTGDATEYESCDSSSSCIGGGIVAAASTNGYDPETTQISSPTRQHSQNGTSSNRRSNGIHHDDNDVLVDDSKHKRRSQWNIMTTWMYNGAASGNVLSVRILFCIAVLVLALFIYVIFAHFVITATTTTRYHHLVHTAPIHLPKDSIVHSRKEGRCNHPKALDEENQERAKRPNYGYLALMSLRNFVGDNNPLFQRQIRQNDTQLFEEEYTEYIKLMNKQAGSQRLTKREPYRFLHYDELPFPHEEGQCYRPKWSYGYYPTCNLFHDISMDRTPKGDELLQPYDYKFLGHGTFRQTWLLDDKEKQQDYVMKTNIYNGDEDNFGDYAFSQAQLEGIIMESTSAYKRTNSIYGFCATSLLVERGYPFDGTIIQGKHYRYYKQQYLDDRYQRHGDVQPLNKFTPEEKLRLSLAMAESLAVIHGHPYSVVANHDLSFEQWLYDKDGIVKLNDFNKARLPGWDYDKQEYCTFYSNQDSVYRAPEEMEGGQANESADVYTFGKMMFTILTGLLPHYEKENETKAYKAIMTGEPPFVDPRYKKRSLIERRLVEAMDMCWQHEQKDRANIFQVIEHLRETARMARISQQFLDQA